MEGMGLAYTLSLLFRTTMIVVLGTESMTRGNSTMEDDVFVDGMHLFTQIRCSHQCISMFNSMK